MVLRNKQQSKKKQQILDKLYRSSKMKNVQILAVAHALIAGARGENGGAPSKDSVFGIATVQGNLCSFGGRRGGVLRFKTYKKTDIDAVLKKFEGKLTGNPFGKNVEGVYAVVEGAALETLIPNTAETIGKGYYKAMAGGKLNTNSTKKKPAKVAEAA
jgi:hypothetical protein